MSLFVTTDGTVYADNGYKGTVEKWTLDATESTVATKVNGSCFGLFIDIMNNLYCSLGAMHQVLKQPLVIGENISETLSVGNGVCGSALNMLCEPRGIFVTIKLSLYVADCKNNRIILFLPGQRIGETVLGDMKISRIGLNCPSDVIVDADDHLFIVDSKNNRIIRSTSNGSYCIVGCLTVRGSAYHQLNGPSTVAFDKLGNIIVADTYNYRVLKFMLITNTNDAQSLPIQATYKSYITTNSPKFIRDCIQPNYYYEAIEVKVAEYGKNKFDPTTPLINRLNKNDGNGCNDQFKLVHNLEKQRTYILVVTIFPANETGSFTITVFGRNNVTLKRSDRPSSLIQATYTSHLTMNSSKYYRSADDIEPNHNYELIEVNVTEDGSYTLGSDSEMNTYGYLYQNKFDPFADAFVYFINENDDGGCNYQFKLTYYLYKHIKYILMITTFAPNETGSFSIFVLGPNNVTLERSGEYSRDCTQPNYYYEAIEVNVIEDGSYSLSAKSPIKTAGYLYENKFNPFNRVFNQINKNNHDGRDNQFTLSFSLQKQITYILVVTTFSATETGPFTIIAIGPSKVTLKHSDSPLFLGQATYTSKLTINSSKHAYYPADIQPNRYYETIEINVAEDGNYTLGSDNEIGIYGAVYKNRFNPFSPDLNKIFTFPDRDCIHRIDIISYFEKQKRYILMVTTSTPNETGSFSVFAFGPNNITLKRSDSPSVPIQAIYASHLTTNSSKYSRDCIQPNYYYEAIEINVAEDGSYILGIDYKQHICIDLYENKFNPFNPFENQMKEFNENVDFDYISSVSVQPTYVSNLTTSSTTYSRDCTQPNYYYEAIEVNVIEDGSYTFGSHNLNHTSCFLGSLCYFYEKTIGLTLDDIIRNYIRRDTTFNNQPFTVKMSAAITIIMFIVGLINGVLSFITFQNKELREIGCGIYLLASSITSLITISLFTVKFWFLVLTHMNLSMNVSVMSGGCKSIEPILKMFLYLDTWLNACVAIERAVNVSRGASFNKAKSKRIARWVIMILPLCIILSLIHEPIKREVFEFKTDDNATLAKNETLPITIENSVYCITRYSSSLENYNTVILFFHLLIPFIINLFSALYIIFGAARQRLVAQPNRTYKEHAHEQFKQHKQLLISPLILIILASPRLVIALLSACVDVSQNTYLYLSAYFISFIPSMLVFIIFVLPSSFYKEKLANTLRSWQQRFCR
ncbi:unnamed protein product [Adineta ricciae]|uniref:G-protein coupled receptors family 1 profile domain-containing protein n=1 Tax=Adineta ricciae TaxID=249248 RepID=A0A814UBF6_ADIRI|nr:unnamed protein product [Adineta ricciae]